MFEFLRSDPLFRLDYNSTKESQRQITRARAYALVKAGFVSADPLGLPAGEREHHRQYADALSFHDNSINTLLGAQFTLFAGSIARLGSDHHLQHFLPHAASLSLRGCFALTELGHGSNVRGIETTATFDPVRDEFVINTPTETAQKYWIGGGAEWAQIATVFAQLYIGTVHYGVHAFLVPLRDQADHRPLPGVRIRDCGHKMGLNGVDNGRFWFDHVRVPRTNLLDRFGGVSRDGEYNSFIANNDLRFAVTMGNLLTGRVALSRGSTNLCKIALATALRYASTRRQFGGPPGGPEVPIINYTTHQVRLLPLLATTYAFDFMSRKAWLLFEEAQANTDLDAIKRVHVLVSGLKALSTWHMTQTIQTCREACGGQGYKSSNRIGIIKADGDIQLTYEGDNAVLLQQVSKDLVKTALSVPPAQLRDDLELRRRVDGVYLHSGDAQLRSFRLHEAILIHRLKTEYEAAKASGLQGDDALETCATLATDAGRAHIERIVFEEFLRAEKEAPSSLSPALSLLRSLFAISRFDTSPSFLREQHFTVEKQRAVHKAMVGLCAELRDLATTLVDGFDIPPFLLGDIAGDWVLKNSFASEDSP